MKVNLIRKLWKQKKSKKDKGAKRPRPFWKSKKDDKE
jgi:hypothetical protein